ncbi:hypothetical protein ACHAXS_003128, partial [Conticribra weissflogii]
PYPLHRSTFKQELDYFCQIQVLEHSEVLELASANFVTPKKDGWVCWISDLQELNKVIQRKQFLLPIMSDILRKRKGYKLFTKLNISMQYYTFELNDKSKDFCAIITPFGKYCYQQLPMGLKCSPNFVHEIMEDVLQDIKECNVCLDDIDVFSFSWGKHIMLLAKFSPDLKKMGSLLTLLNVNELFKRQIGLVTGSHLLD